MAVCLLVLAAFVVQLLGGRGSVPGWQQLRAVLGVPLQTEESAPQTADGSTVVYVLDVGQGDAVLLCQDGAYCLIDTGPVEAEDALLYDLDVLGVPSLEYLVLTHPHADHTGNARAVLRTLPVKTLLLPLWQPTADETADWPRYLAELAADSGAEILTAEAGEEYPLGSGTLQILQGGSEDADSVNDASLCTLFTAGDFRFLDTAWPLCRQSGPRPWPSAAGCTTITAIRTALPCKITQRSVPRYGALTWRAASPSSGRTTPSTWKLPRTPPILRRKNKE